MNLDRWLGKDLTNKLLTPPNSDDCIRKPLRVFHIKPRQTLKNITSMHQRVKRGKQPNAAMVSMRQLSYMNLDTAALDSPASTVTGLPDHDVLCAGLPGQVLIFDSKQTAYGSISLSITAGSSGNAPVRDLTAWGSKQILACTDDSVLFCDIRSARVTSHLPTNDKVFGFTSLAVSENMAAVGTKAGSAYICDLRANKVSSTIWDAHDPHRRSRQCQTQRGPSLTAVEWSGDKTIATASIQDQTVKFWDIRKFSQPVNQVAMLQRAPIGGISALASDSEHKVWALGRNGALESMLPTQELPIDTFGHVKTQSYVSRLCVIDSDFATPLIAASGVDGITILNRPTLAQGYSFSNEMSAHELVVPAEIRGVYWHMYSKTLVAVGGDECYFWQRAKQS